jgi:peroxiredoxin
VKEATAGPARAFVADNRITFPVVFDEGARTALELGRLPIRGLPATVLIDRRGRVAAIYSQAVQPADIIPVLSRLVNEA